jgi:ribosome biogenesis GTPase
MNSHKEFKTHFGWNDFFENQLTLLLKNDTSLRCAKVINEERNLYRLQFSENEIVSASITGKMQFDAKSRADYPAVGDWVLAEFHGTDQRAVIKELFKRKSSLERKQVGSTTDVQILSTNVDTIFITTSLNGDLNVGRLERYLTFAWDSGATPVIVLTKADLCEDVDEVILDLRLRFPAVEIFALSNTNYEEAYFLQNYLRAGTTTVIVGSSGVGKSTLTNYLIGREEIRVQDISGYKDKGLHTTTSRSLYESQYGGLVIDTPGMRELQFADHEEGLQHQYGDIEELILQCRFNNCAHQTEKDCAVIEALETGELLEDRWKSYKKIQSEIRHSLRKMDKVLLSEDRKQWKKRSMEARRNNEKRNY